MRALLAVALVLAHTGVTPFEQGEQGGIILPVRLNGRGPFQFLLDTGSTHTSVSQRTAAAIGAPVVAKAPMASVAGSRETLVARIDALDVGPLVVSKVLASVVGLDDLRGRDAIDGVLGQDVLDQVRYTIDFRRREILWWPHGQTLARGITLELTPSQGRFVVSLPQTHSVLRLVPDSGAATLVLFERRPNLLPLTPLPGRTRVMTLSAGTNARLAQLRELRVGDMMLTDVAAVVIDRGGAEPGETDGLLPLHLFHRVTMDGPKGRLVLEGRRDAGLMFF